MPTIAQLTPRQKQIAALIAEGKSNKDIAAALGLSAGTVKTCCSHIYARLRIHSRLQLALWWREQQAALQQEQV